MDTVTASIARAILPEILDRVEAGEEITILRHGRPVAVVISPASWRTRNAGRAIARAGAIRAALEQARGLPLPGAGLSGDRADALVEEVRATRAGC